MWTWLCSRGSQVSSQSCVGLNVSEDVLVLFCVRLLLDKDGMLVVEGIREEVEGTEETVVVVAGCLPRAFSLRRGLEAPSAGLDVAVVDEA